VLDTGALWSDTYTVASSAGIRAYMDSHGWKVFYTEKIFVFRRYELALIRSAVNDHIKEILDEVKNGANSTSAAQ
jgi:hypothetical protein